MAWTDSAQPAKPQSEEVQQAIRWERIKDTAAARQAHEEGRHPARTPQVKPAPAPASSGVKVGDPGVQPGVRWERSKVIAKAKKP